jgi:membrane fusion protein (multidrug efflux system)
MKGNIIRYVSYAAATLLIGYLIASRVGLFEKKETDTASATSAPNAMNVSAIVATPKLLTDQLRTTGSLLAEEEVQLTAEVAGRIMHIGFEEGQRVEKGALLLKTDDEQLRAQLKKVTHQMALAYTQEKRLRELKTIEAVSQEELDRAITERMSLQADSALLGAQIARTSIFAPFSGTVGLRSVSPGQYVTANTPIAKLVKTTPLKLEFAVPERHLHLIKAGGKVTFTTADGKVRSAVIYAMQPGIDPSTRSGIIRARYANSENELVPGFFADVNVALDERKNALAVPTEAVIPELGKVKLLLSKSGVVTPTYVTTGIRTADELEILDGLNPGDTVITSGMLQLRPGMPVSVSVTQ